MQIGIDCLVSNSHRPAAKFEQFLILLQNNFVVLEPILRISSRLNDRFAFCEIQRVPEGAYRTKPRCRQTSAASAANAFAFSYHAESSCFHAELSNPSAATIASQSARISSSTSSGSFTVLPTSSRKIWACRLRD